MSYVEFHKKPNGLEIVPTAEGVEAAIAGELTLEDALESYICNGWLYVQPEHIGALTDATIISEDGLLNDDGAWKPVIPQAVVYAHMNYETEDPVETWAKGQSVFFVRSEVR